ncbi:alpha/beta hydrolase [Paenibacillus silvae]|uniref:Alpha/beta hydrolase n=2 Tax=Paenibacillus silvae TaxID=1325358 RepID=A0A2W6PHL7_9BACL|nr:alpha/beta hydrolase [Paenibacillus silvae]
MIGSMLAVAAVTAGGLWQAAVKSQTPKKIPITMKPPMPFEDITFESGGGQVQGWFIPAKSDVPEPWPLVIIAHGWGSNRSRVLRYARPIWEAGYALLMYDVRSHGASDPVRAASAYLFRDDLLAALTYVSGRPEINPEAVGVLGHSLGGLGTILALTEGIPVSAVITDSMPSQFQVIVSSELRRRRLPLFPLAQVIPRIWFWRLGESLKTYQQNDPVMLLNERRKGMQLPLLMVHSKGDNFIPPSELEYFMSKADPPVEHLWVNSEGHSCSEEDPAFWDTVIPFLKSHVRSVPHQTVQNHKAAVQDSKTDVS